MVPVRIWLNSVLTILIGIDHSEQNLIRKLGEIPYYLAGALFPKFRSESNQFHSVSVGHRQDLFAHHPPNIQNTHQCACFGCLADPLSFSTHCKVRAEGTAEK